MTEPRTDPSGAAIRVLIADDQAVFRRGLSVVLSSEEGIEVVAEAEDGVQAVAKAEELAPDVVVMDVRMPHMNGVRATRAIRNALPTTRIIVLTVSDDEDDLFDALKAGADGYLLKEISIEEVAQSIRSVAQGNSLISPSMASKMFEEFRSLARQASENEELPPPELTTRELEVLRLMAQSKSNRDIAEELFISENTVKNHVRNILEKLHLHSRMQAVMYAMRKRMLDASE